jgi:rhodanese-related sulfurtransferase
MKTWQRVLIFPLLAIALGLMTKALMPDGWSGRDSAEYDEFPKVTWKETAPRVQAGDWLLVDAREEEHFQAQHIPGALSLPAHSYPELLEFFAEDHGTEKTVVVYCGTEDCDLSVELALRLRDEAGCHDIRILDGGFLAWRRAE